MLQIIPVTGLPEVVAGTDLPALLASTGFAREQGQFVDSTAQVKLGRACIPSTVAPKGLAGSVRHEPLPVLFKL